MRKMIFVLIIILVLAVSSFAQNVYFDWPIPVQQYDYNYSYPNRTASRALGEGGNHSGEDVTLNYG